MPIVAEAYFEMCVRCQSKNRKASANLQGGRLAYLHVAVLVSLAFCCLLLGFLDFVQKLFLKFFWRVRKDDCLPALQPNTHNKDWSERSSGFGATAKKQAPKERCSQTHESIGESLTMILSPNVSMYFVGLFAEFGVFTGNFLRSLCSCCKLMAS